MSPHTRYIPVAVGVLILTAACGSPDRAEPTTTPQPYAGSGQPSVALPPPSFGSFSQPPGLPGLPGLPGGGVPTWTPPTWTPPTYAYPTGTTPTTTPTGAPLTKSPTPTPAHAAKCSGQPTGAEILALVKGQPGVPKKTLQVQSGPYCSGTWSFTSVKLAGTNSDQQEPLNVVAIGKGSTLTLVAAGSDVCNPQVQANAPAGIRVFACGV